MSATADVHEMQSICTEIAKLASGSALKKNRIADLAVLIGVTENRALEFLRAKARRVDSWEKDRARKIRDELKDAARRQRDHEHLLWLAEQAEGMDGRMVDALQHLLRSRGYEAGTLALSEAEHDDQSVNWR